MIYHWCPVSVWEETTLAYSPAGLAADGFIHCSFLHQVEKTASALDRGRMDLVLLCVRERGLPVVVEDCYEAGEEYPHVYGPIPIESVAAILSFPPESDGSFRLPRGIPT